jgi:hypothetical protein
MRFRFARIGNEKGTANIDASKDAIHSDRTEKMAHDMLSWAIATRLRTLPLDGYDAPAHDAGRILFGELSRTTTARSFIGNLKFSIHGWLPFQRFSEGPANPFGPQFDSVAVMTRMLIKGFHALTLCANAMETLTVRALPARLAPDFKDSVV